ncbi:polysaccharide deacetylase family protein [Kytococcus sedentarius]|uniref:polysaccharide deacetylase family protein n=1 Tax=Kytococcus sedentarius TaxID=1276 RepID=UPI003879D23C
MSHRRGLATLVALGVVSTTAATAHSYRVEHAAAPSESQQLAAADGWHGRAGTAGTPSDETSTTTETDPTSPRSTSAPTTTTKPAPASVPSREAPTSTSTAAPSSAPSATATATATATPTPPAASPAVHQSAGRTHEKVLHLTFDDGPDPTWTPQMLEVLEKHDATATFFMVGEEAARFPGLVKSVRGAGHAVGNHGWDHPQFPAIGPAGVRQQLTATRDVVGPGSCFRAPYGEVDATVLAAAGQSGYTASWFWTADVRDWTEPGTQQIAAGIVRGAAPGAVYVLHDGGHQPRADRPRSGPGPDGAGCAGVDLRGAARLLIAPRL